MSKALSIQKKIRSGCTDRETERQTHQSFYRLHRDRDNFQLKSSHQYLQRHILFHNQVNDSLIEIMLCLCKHCVPFLQESLGALISFFFSHQKMTYILKQLKISPCVINQRCFPLCKISYKVSESLTLEIVQPLKEK